MITIIFNDDIAYTYSSFEEILKLENYNDITYLNYSHTIKSPIYSLIIHILCFTGFKIYSLPKLPNSLQELWCDNNYLYSLPELPNSLTKLICYNNNISRLPELPNSLEYLSCGYNNLSNLPELPNLLKFLNCRNNKFSYLPELPNSLQYFICSNNNLSSLPKIPNSAYIFNYDNNPIHFHIKKYFYNNTKKYFDHQRQMRRIFVNKIGNWYLDCKYNPKYLYCRNRLMKEYKELYGK
jgi:Leucine-rich repeat (LRR) protein